MGQSQNAHNVAKKMLLLLLLAAVRAKDPTAAELKEYADLFRCGAVKLGDQLWRSSTACGDSLARKASPRDACAKRCARTRTAAPWPIQ